MMEMTDAGISAAATLVSFARVAAMVRFLRVRNA